MTPEGRSFVLYRLTQAPDLDALRRVWDSLGDDYKRDPDVIAQKDLLKAGLEK